MREVGCALDFGEVCPHDAPPFPQSSILCGDRGLDSTSVRDVFEVAMRRGLGDGMVRRDLFGGC